MYTYKGEEYLAEFIRSLIIRLSMNRNISLETEFSENSQDDIHNSLWFNELLHKISSTDLSKCESEANPRSVMRYLEIFNIFEINDRDDRGIIIDRIDRVLL